MYEQFYGLRERPFSLTPDPDYLYPSRIHAQALTQLREGLASGTDFIVLTGEIGSGKTTLLHAALRAENPHTAVSWIVNTQLDARELVESVVLGFGLEPRPDSSDERLHEYLAQFLRELEDVGRGALLVIDEAQNLDLLALDRLLTTLEDVHAPRLRVVLVGQPSLSDLLRAKDLQRLRQRIGVRYHLRSLDASDTASYINHRLHHASIADAVEFPEAVSVLIYQHSQGIPRRINVLSDTVLLHGYGEGKRAVDLDVARVALADLARSGAFAPPAHDEPADEPADELADEQMPQHGAAAVLDADLPLHEDETDVLRVWSAPVEAPRQSFEERRARRPRRNLVLRPASAIVAALVMTVVAAAPGFRKPRPLESRTLDPAITPLTLSEDLPSPLPDIPVPDTAPTSGQIVNATRAEPPGPLAGPSSDARGRQAASVTQAPAPIPPISQRPEAGLRAATPAAAAPAESVSPRPPAFPPVAETSIQSLPVMPLPRSAPALAAPARVPVTEAPATVALTPPISSPPPAAAVAAAPSSAPSTVLNSAALDERSVRAVVNQYRAAFSALNASAAKAVWPTVDERALGRAFSQLESQSFQFEGCDVSVTGSRATAKCGGNARFVPKVGDRTPRVEPRTWNFELQKANTEWVIQRVLAR